MIREALAGAAAVVQKSIDDDGSFGDYVRAVYDSRAFIQFWVLCLFGFIGMTANYTYKWLSDEIKGSLWYYMVGSRPRRTLLALATFAGYALTTVISPVLDGAGWSVVVNLGLTTGFAVDALVNKADRQVWTDEERAKRDKV